MEDAKKASLGIRKRNKRKTKRMFKNIVEYLKSDSYMFSRFGSNGRSDRILGFGMAELSGRKRKKRTMLEKVEEFLKSDFHMYASLISSRKLGPPPIKGHLQYANRVSTTTVEVSTSGIVDEDDQPTPQSKTLIRKDQYSKRSHTAEMSIQATGRDETMQHPFHHHRRLSSSSSLPEKEMLKPKLRRVAID